LRGNSIACTRPCNQARRAGGHDVIERLVEQEIVDLRQQHFLAADIELDGQLID
jgi:hypothetical protein